MPDSVNVYVLNERQLWLKYTLIPMDTCTGFLGTLVLLETKRPKVSPVKAVAIEDAKNSLKTLKREYYLCTTLLGEILLVKTHSCKVYRFIRTYDAKFTKFLLTLKGG